MQTNSKVKRFIVIGAIAASLCIRSTRTSVKRSTGPRSCSLSPLTLQPATLVAEKYRLGYAKSVLLFAGVIVVTAVAHFELGLNAILAFWAAHVMTRPLGASIRDLFPATQTDPRCLPGRMPSRARPGYHRHEPDLPHAILAVVVYLTNEQRRHPSLIEAND